MVGINSYQVLLVLVLVFASFLPFCEPLCDTTFDAIVCDTDSKGLMFRDTSVWELECLDDEILIDDNSKRGTGLKMTAALSDNKFTYLFQGETVFIANGLDLNSARGPLKVTDVFDGFSNSVSAAFFIPNEAYLFEAKNHKFDVYTNRAYRKNKMPFWSFAFEQETDLKLLHPKIKSISSAFSKFSSARGRSELVIIFDKRSYFTLDATSCITRQGSEMKYNSTCLESKPGEVGKLFRCVTKWIWWQIVLLITILIIIIPILTYALIVCICCLRDRGSGTFRHEQTCCTEKGDFSQLPAEDTDRPDGMWSDSGSETNTITSSHFKENRSSIDLTESHYGKYGKY